MDLEQLNQHLSQISTTWTALYQAHGGSAESAKAAQWKLLQRYQAAVYRYLLAAVRDPDAADDLFQEFALRFLRGDFKRADPERGRFRNFLKTALYHLIVDHQRRHQHRPRPLPVDGPEPTAAAPPPAESDSEFLTIWRAELMARAWDALAEHDRATGQHLHTVLRFRTDHPDVRSPQMAEQLAARVGKPLSPEWVRKRLYLAREKFTDLLLDEVTRSLDRPTPDEVERELLDLGLWEYCRAAFARRHGDPAAP
jgi:RNA polymerase sigma-70 factor (ECF subfamily)